MRNGLQPRDSRDDDITATGARPSPPEVPAETPGPRPPSLFAGYIAITLAAACWGTSGIFIKLIMSEGALSAIALAFWRDVAAFLLFFTVGFLRDAGALRVRRTDLGALAGMGASIGLFHIAWNLGVFLNGAAVTTIQQAAMPVIVVIAARFFWGEPLTWSKMVSIFLVFAGTVLVSGIISSGERNLSTTALVAGLCVPVFYAGWSIFRKRLSAEYPAEVILTYAFGVAVMVLFPFQFFIAPPGPVSARALFWFTGLTIVGTGGGFFAYTYGLGRLPAGIASILAMSEILFVSVYGYLLLNERLVGWEILGTGFVTFGVLLLFVPQSPRRAATV